jgi:hypothetical protein
MLESHFVIEFSDCLLDCVCGCLCACLGFPVVLACSGMNLTTRVSLLLINLHFYLPTSCYPTLFVE